jgi:hypothetical protein
MLVLAVKSSVLKLLRRADSLLAYNTSLRSYFATKLLKMCCAARVFVSSVYKICLGSYHGATAPEANICSGIGLDRYIANEQ